MSEVSQAGQTNNIGSTTPLYTYTPQQIVTPQGQSVSITPSNITAPFYQYPNTSIYNSNPKQAASGVNIYIYNPSGLGGPSSNSTANANYMLPNQNQTAATTNVNPQTEPRQAAAANTPIANAPISPQQNSEKILDEKENKTVVELTDNYIKTLENFLKSNDKDIRKSAIIDLIKRFEEDETRRDNPALTALLNIALQDPDDNNRMLAMTPVATGSAKGDDNTAILLQGLSASDKLYGTEAKMANESLLNNVQKKVSKN